MPPRGSVCNVGKFGRCFPVFVLLRPTNAAAKIKHFDPAAFDFGKKKAFPMRPGHFFASCEKAMTDLDWAPEYNTVDGLRDSYENDFVHKKVRRGAGDVCTAVFVCWLGNQRFWLCWPVSAGCPCWLGSGLGCACCLAGFAVLSRTPGVGRRTWSCLEYHNQRPFWGF